VTQDVAVTVNSCETINSFTATPASIAQGQSATLAWSVSNYTNGRIIMYDPQMDEFTIILFFDTTNNPGQLVVTPSSTRSYTLQLFGACPAVNRGLTVTVQPATGNVLIGPQGHPDAVGPTDNNDDYTNKTQIGGVAVAPGGVTTAGATIVFTNTVKNLAIASDTITLTAPYIGSQAAGFSVELSRDGGATYVPLNAGQSATLTVCAGCSADVSVRVTAPSGLSVLGGWSTVIRATSGLTPSVRNDTIDRVWTGFVRALKSYTVTNTTGVGGPTDPVPGAVIEYAVNYSNVTAAAGAGNVDLTATNVVLTEDGNAAPNNWGSTTNHAAGSASDTLGGTITGDAAGSTLLRDTVPSLAPGSSGVFKFRRVIK
jgi:hypothetical protein